MLARDNDSIIHAVKTATVYWSWLEQHQIEKPVETELEKEEFGNLKPRVNARNGDKELSHGDVTRLSKTDYL